MQHTERLGKLGSKQHGLLHVLAKDHKGIQGQAEVHRRNDDEEVQNVLYLEGPGSIRTPAMTFSGMVSSSQGP